MSKKLLFQSKGSCTLEAALILPTILLILISMLYTAMFIYEKIVVLDAVTYTSAQRAATWDNSSKNLEGGFQIAFSGDGLYWRLFNDWDNADLAEFKNRDAQNFVTSMLKHGVFDRERCEIQVSYDHSLITRVVSVGVEENVIIPMEWAARLNGSGIAITAKADVTEPVEYIRNSDFMEQYGENSAEGFGSILEQFGADSQIRSYARPVFVSNASGYRPQVYHYPGCRHLANIKKENLQQFGSYADAQGYHICADCAERFLKAYQAEVE